MIFSWKMPLIDWDKGGRLVLWLKQGAGIQEFNPAQDFLSNLGYLISLCLSSLSSACMSHPFLPFFPCLIHLECNLIRADTICCTYDGASPMTTKQLGHQRWHFHAMLHERVLMRWEHTTTNTKHNGILMSVGAFRCYCITNHSNTQDIQGFILLLETVLICGWISRLIALLWKWGGYWLSRSWLFCILPSLQHSFYCSDLGLWEEFPNTHFPAKLTLFNQELAPYVKLHYPMMDYIRQDSPESHRSEKK